MTHSIAETLARKQKEISVAEFFERNKQVLGFDSLSRALITGVKEGVDNSLDACEEAGMLPDISVKVEQLDKNEYRITAEDNGPGIVERNIPNVFARLLFGSRFHAVRQSRGQQGIGISAVVMYGQLTTGKPATVRSKVAEKDVAVEMDLILDTKSNMPKILGKDYVIWEREHGTYVSVALKGRYVAGKQSVLEYLRGTAIVNPHAQILFTDPSGTVYAFKRASDVLPAPVAEVKPHPEGIELGTLMNMAKATKSTRMSSFLKTEFSRISDRVAKEICEKAQVPLELKPKALRIEQAKRIIDAIGGVRIMAPETTCLSPIGEVLIKKGLKNVLGGLKPSFYAPPVTRKPKVYSGHPFMVEVGLVYGGEMPSDQPVEILRFANRVPLLYQQGACAITAAVENIDWRNYGLEQRGGKGIPYGPGIVLVHCASTKIPFTSEAKEAIANVPEIREEIENALRGCARALKLHLAKSARRSKTREKFEIVQRLLPKIAEKCSGIVKKPVPDLAPAITRIMDIVWVDDKVEYVNSRHRAVIEIYNYTQTGKKLDFYAVVPNGHLVLGSVQPRPAEVREGRIHWELKRIPSMERLVLGFELEGLDKEMYDENELYSAGVDPSRVIGAEPLPGDWGIRTEAMEVVEPEEEEEVDYDTAKEAVADE
ncbi:MAG: DNA topoisomerase VI subunit B [Candidatus Thermoplasmatota archaeon]